MGQMTEHAEFKIAFTGIFTLLTSVLGNLAFPMFALFAMNVADYVTGLMAAPYRNQTINSYKGFRGIAKKICMFLLVGVGLILDEMVIYVGLDLPMNTPIAIMVALWLVANEIISLLENVKDIGVKIPKFLEKLTKLIRSQTEVNVPGDDEEC